MSDLRGALKVYDRYDSARADLHNCDMALGSANYAIHLLKQEVSMSKERISASDSAYAYLSKSNEVLVKVNQNCVTQIKRENKKGTLKSIFSGIGGGGAGAIIGILIGIFVAK